MSKLKRIGLGEVIWVGRNDAMGNLLQIRYQNVIIYDRATSSFAVRDVVVTYAHLASSSVNVGDIVSVNQFVATMGNIDSVRPLDIHLHMDIPLESRCNKMGEFSHYAQASGVWGRVLRSKVLHTLYLTLRLSNIHRQTEGLYE